MKSAKGGRQRPRPGPVTWYVRCQKDAVDLLVRHPAPERTIKAAHALNDEGGDGYRMGTGPPTDPIDREQIDRINAFGRERGAGVPDVRHPKRGPPVCLDPLAWHRRGMSSKHPSPPRVSPLRPAPDEASLREAALNYLARYATTEAGLRQVLHRRIDLWARQAAGVDDAGERAAAAKASVAGVVARLVELGLLNDAAFAESRARGLALSGRSRRAIAGRLMAKGIDPDRARAVLPEGDEAELVSALILARKRRIGPFRTAEPNQNRELGVLARAGFPRDVALRALGMEAEEAEEAIRVARG